MIEISLRDANYIDFPKQNAVTEVQCFLKKSSSESSHRKYLLNKPIFRKA